MPGEEILDARRNTDELFELVEPGSLYERTIPERHRLIFYLGHLEAFDRNLLERAGGPLRSTDPGLDRLFAFGIDPPPGALPADVPADWPELPRVREYAWETRRIVDEALGEAPPGIARMALEHRLMHAETFAYLLHNLDPARMAVPPGALELASGDAPASEMIAIPAGVVRLGRSREAGFGWDNEFESHEARVPAFRISRHKVTNGEYLKFVEAGGPAPHYWRRRGNGWRLRVMFGEVPLPLDHPVYATGEQAAAYAAWRGCGLPSEAQWQHAAYGTPRDVGRESDEREFPWGEQPPGAIRGNFDFHHWDTVPVDCSPAGASVFGVEQMLGNGWEWTSTLFHPFPAFRPMPFYEGYSANFFDGEHFVLKGGGPRTARQLLRSSFRNWFRGGYPYVHAAFRCVEESR